jgi:preprotein translocase subunit SecE
MAKDQALPPVTRQPRQAPPVRQAAAISARAEEHAPKKPFNPMLFLREVRAEAKKITWPTRRETWITTVMVMIMVLITALFFFVVDLGLSFGVTQILKLGG